MKEMSVHVKAIGAYLKRSESPKKSTALGTAAARKIESAAATGEKEKIAAAMPAFGNAARGGCHSDFRAPKPAKAT